MVVCKRCKGYINTTPYEDVCDPYCVNCGCTYPELAASKNGTRKPKGLRETVRYTGDNPHRKKQMGYITFAKHPNRGNLFPMLIVECPMCRKKSKVITASANPLTYHNENSKFINGYKLAKQHITCPTGHFFKLKVNNEGMYSWE